MQKIINENNTILLTIQSRTKVTYTKSLIDQAPLLLTTHLRIVHTTVGHNLVKWPLLYENEAGECSLYSGSTTVIERRKDSYQWSSAISVMLNKSLFRVAIKTVTLY